MARKINNRNTKAEILDAYSELDGELKEMRRQMKELEKQKKQVVEEATATPALPIVGEAEEVSLLSVEQLLSALDALRGGFTDSLGVLQGQLSSEAQQLQRIRARADDYARQIHELHGFEVDEGTLDRVVTRYRETANTFDEEHDERVATLEAEAASANDAWKGESSEHAAAVEARDAEISKARAREQQEYDYDLTHRRALEQETYETARRRREQSLEELETTRREGMADREDELSGREKAYAELVEKVGGFPARFDAALKKAEGEGRGIAGRNAKVKADLLSRETEGRRRVFELRIASLEQTATKQRTEIENLNTQLTEAQRQAQELAVKAIEGASNASSFDAVRDIAMEQAKHAPKGK